MRDDIEIQIRDIKTNRRTTCNSTDTVKIQELIISYVEKEKNRCSFISNLLQKFAWLIPLNVEKEKKALRSYLEPLVRNFNTTLYLENKIFYRGVKSSTPIGSNQIGPAPNPADGRYNIKGEKCIYLIDNVDLLFSELNSSDIRVQKYNIPIDTLKIADLSPNNNGINNNLASAFQMAEWGMTLCGYCFEDKLINSKKSKYLISQLLSSLFKQYKWDGMYIPGVHGENGQHYHNLSIFGTIVDKWADWADGESFQKKL